MQHSQAPSSPPSRSPQHSQPPTADINIDDLLVGVDIGDTAQYYSHENKSDLYKLVVTHDNFALAQALGTYTTSENCPITHSGYVPDSNQQDGDYDTNTTPSLSQVTTQLGLWCIKAPEPGKRITNPTDLITELSDLSNNPSSRQPTFYAKIYSHSISLFAAALNCKNIDAFEMILNTVQRIYGYVNVSLLYDLIECDEFQLYNEITADNQKLIKIEEKHVNNISNKWQHISFFPQNSQNPPRLTYIPYDITSRRTILNLLLNKYINNDNISNHLNNCSSVQICSLISFYVNIGFSYQYPPNHVNIMRPTPPFLSSDMDHEKSIQPPNDFDGVPTYPGNVLSIYHFISNDTPNVIPFINLYAPQSIAYMSHHASAINIASLLLKQPMSIVCDYTRDNIYFNVYLVAPIIQKYQWLIDFLTFIPLSRITSFADKLLPTGILQSLFSNEQDTITLQEWYAILFHSNIQCVGKWLLLMKHINPHYFLSICDDELTTCVHSTRDDATRPFMDLGITQTRDTPLSLLIATLVHNFIVHCIPAIYTFQVNNVSLTSPFSIISPSTEQKIGQMFFGSFLCETEDLYAHHFTHSYAAEDLFTILSLFTSLFFPILDTPELLPIYIVFTIFRQMQKPSPSLLSNWLYTHVNGIITVFLTREPQYFFSVLLNLFINTPSITMTPPIFTTPQNENLTLGLNIKAQFVTQLFPKLVPVLPLPIYLMFVLTECIGPYGMYRERFQFNTDTQRMFWLTTALPPADLVQSNFQPFMFLSESNDDESSTDVAIQNSCEKVQIPQNTRNDASLRQICNQILMDNIIIPTLHRFPEVICTFSQALGNEKINEYHVNLYYYNKLHSISLEQCPWDYFAKQFAMLSPGTFHTPEQYLASIHTVDPRLREIFPQTVSRRPMPFPMKHSHSGLPSLMFNPFATANLLTNSLPVRSPVPPHMAQYFQDLCCALYDCNDPIDVEKCSDTWKMRQMIKAYTSKMLANSDIPREKVEFMPKTHLEAFAALSLTDYLKLLDPIQLMDENANNLLKTLIIYDIIPSQAPVDDYDPQQPYWDPNDITFTSMLPLAHPNNSAPSHYDTSKLMPSHMLMITKLLCPPILDLVPLLITSNPYLAQIKLYTLFHLLVGIYLSQSPQVTEYLNKSYIDVDSSIRTHFSSIFRSNLTISTTVEYITTHLQSSSPNNQILSFPLRKISLVENGGHQGLFQPISIILPTQYYYSPDNGCPPQTRYDTVSITNTTAALQEHYTISYSPGKIIRSFFDSGENGCDECHLIDIRAVLRQKQFQKPISLHNMASTGINSIFQNNIDCFEKLWLFYYCIDPKIKYFFDHIETIGSMRQIRPHIV